MITRFQGHRLDDQRTSLPPALMSNSSGVGKKKEEDLLEVLWQVQGSRIEEQRCHMMSAPHVMPAASHWEETEAECLTADELFELIFTCQVHCALECSLLLIVLYVCVCVCVCVVEVNSNFICMCWNALSCFPSCWGCARLLVFMTINDHTFVSLVHSRILVSTISDPRSQRCRYATRAQCQVKISLT